MLLISIIDRLLTKIGAIFNYSMIRNSSEYVRVFNLIIVNAILIMVIIKLVIRLIWGGILWLSGNLIDNGARSDQMIVKVFSLGCFMQLGW